MDPESKDESQRTLVVVEGNEVELSKNGIVLKPEDQITETEILKGNEVELSKNGIVLKPEDEITKTEILKTLHVEHNIYSFKSTEDDSKIYAAMFSDSEIAENYQKGETKIKYFVQFGMAPYIKVMLIFDIDKTPFSFLFYKTTNSQLQKQYDGYIRYWSKCQKEVVTADFGSLFIGHCDSNQLMEHYYGI